MPAGFRHPRAFAAVRAVVLGLALASQAAAAVGMPVAKVGCGGLCGCGNTPNAGCCCGPKKPAAKSVPPKRLACCGAGKSCCSTGASCCSLPADPGPAGPVFVWLPGWQVRGCQGERIPGVPAAEPAVPPPPPAAPEAFVVVGRVEVPAAVLVSRLLVPPDPPPKSG